jgi:2,5-dihydroxypyridine 5,6-dioxygenase
MAISDTEFIAAWTKVLQLSNVKRAETLTILIGVETHPQTLRCATIAATMLGAVVNRLDLPPVNGAKSLSRDPFAYLGGTALSGNPAALAALKASDMVIDLMTLLFSPEQQEILESGTRILLAVEPPEVLVRLVPVAQDRERVQAAARRIAEAKEMHVTSPAGTDLRCPLGEYPAVQEYGFAEQPGRWDHWPSGFVLTWPNEGQTNGTIVLDAGDILLPQKSHVTAPVALTIVNGYCTRIEGGVDAKLLEDYMASFDDPEAYAMSHIGWGLQPRARWSGMSLYGREATTGQEARSFWGNFLCSLGPNNEVGGSRLTACHIDIPIRGCTVRLDGQDVVTRGKVVGHE